MIGMCQGIQTPNNEAEMVENTNDPQSRIRRGHRGTEGPNWRYQLAQSRPVRSSRLAEIRDDPGVRELRGYFMRTLRDGPPEAAAAFPIIAGAADVEQDSALRQTLKLMVVGGLAVEEMQERLKIPAAVIRVWEANYFDVRDGRDQVLWLESHVIRKEREAGNPEFAARLHLAAMAGPEGVRALLDCENAPVDEAERLFQRQLKLNLKYDVATNMPLGSESENFRFLQFSARLMIAGQRLDLARAKLTEKCTRARERHEERKLRLEIAHQQQAARAANAKRVVEARQKAQMSRAAAAEARRELARHRQRAEQMAVAARAAQSPLAQLQWSATADRDQLPTTMSQVEHRPARAPRPKRSSTGRKNPLRIQRDHLDNSDWRAAACVTPTETAVLHHELALTE